MDSADEQDVENPGGMANGANGTNGAHGANGANGTHGTNGQHPTPEGSLYRGEIDESDLDDEVVHDDEDLLSQPLQGSSQSQLDIAPQASSTPTHLTHLNSFMNMHPQLLAKLKLQFNDAELQQTRNGLEVLQAAMSGNFNVPVFPPLYMSPPPPPPLPQQQQHPQNNHSQPVSSLGNMVENPLMMPSTSIRPPAASSQTGESPQRTCRNNSESSQGSSRNNGESRECESRAAASTNTQHPSGSNWNFEEQFRQLYELDDNPDRKEFLDNLFTFMQQRGTPINRLPIMAKSVLDLYELYKLVVTRGGLVEVINKKLWQEIIKGLRLPASITSAAFTLRTQYMKYLYPYEKQKENLSTQEQLQTAIETNRRESRRGNYTTYTTNNDSMRSQHNSSLASTTLQLPMLTMTPMDIHNPHAPFVNGQHHPHNQHVSSSNFSEYMMKLMREKNITPNSIIQQQSGSTSISPPSTEALHAFELSKLYSMYNNNKHQYSEVGQPCYSPSQSSPENNSTEVKEPLDLANSANRSDPISPPSASRSVSSPPCGKRQRDDTDYSPSRGSNKRLRRLSDEENLSENTHNSSMRIAQTVMVRDNGQKELLISVELDGVTFEGVLPAKRCHNDDDSSTSSNSNNRKRPRLSES